MSNKINFQLLALCPPASRVIFFSERGYYFIRFMCLETGHDIISNITRFETNGIINSAELRKHLEGLKCSCARMYQDIGIKKIKLGTPIHFY